MTREERLHRLGHELLAILPESQAWQPQTSNRLNAQETDDGDCWFDVASPGLSDRRLVLIIRSDGDLQLEYHLRGRHGSPFELLFSIPDGEEEAALKEAARFIEGLVTERLVLGFQNGLFRGGRKFLEAALVTEKERRKFSWITSWRGTYDWAS